jgi:hypothetical protein
MRYPQDSCLSSLWYVKIFCAAVGDPECNRRDCTHEQHSRSSGVSAAIAPDTSKRRALPRLAVVQDFKFNSVQYRAFVSNVKRRVFWSSASKSRHRIVFCGHEKKWGPDVKFRSKQACEISLRTTMASVDEEIKILIVSKSWTVFPS